MSNYRFKKNLKQLIQSSLLDIIIDLIIQKTNCQPRLYGCGLKLRCPAHEDKNPSLSISEGADGRILIHCFVGCAIEEVCDSLGIFVKDLFPKKTKQ